MYEIECLDLSGNTIDNFFQWDIDQKVTMRVKGCEQEYLSIAPEVHFSNKSRDAALVVRSTVSDGDTITADVPNVLLQEAYPLLIYVYLTDSQDVSSQKTILYSEIPVRKRQKPSDYLYVDNITRYTAEMIKDEIEAKVESARTNAISSINKSKSSATDSISKSKADFVSTGNALVDEATAIKDNAQKTYEDAVEVTNRTQEDIEENIDTLIKQNGVYLKKTNEDGNVTLSIIVNES